jgi:hypothetical protein
VDSVQKISVNEQYGIVAVTAPATVVGIVGFVLCVTIVWSRRSSRVSCLLQVFSGFIFFQVSGSFAGFRWSVQGPEIWCMLLQYGMWLVYDCASYLTYVTCDSVMYLDRS